jgi:hypothetical protein
LELFRPHIDDQMTTRLEQPRDPPQPAKIVVPIERVPHAVEERHDHATTAAKSLGLMPRRRMERASAAEPTRCISSPARSSAK